MKQTGFTKCTFGFWVCIEQSWQVLRREEIKNCKTESRAKPRFKRLSLPSPVSDARWLRREAQPCFFRLHKNALKIKVVAMKSVPWLFGYSKKILIFQLELQIFPSVTAACEQNSSNHQLENKAFMNCPCWNMRRSSSLKNIKQFIYLYYR